MADSFSFVGLFTEVFIEMNNKTYETIQQTIRRFETILEVDDKLNARAIYCIQTAMTHLSYLVTDESTPKHENKEEA